MKLMKILLSYRPWKLFKGEGSNSRNDQGVTHLYIGEIWAENDSFSAIMSCIANNFGYVVPPSPSNSTKSKNPISLFV